MLAVSWVQFLSGYRVDLAELGAFCKARNILFCVDAIQGVGALQLKVEATGIDFLAAGAHKWLLATQGIGFVYVAPSLLERLRPPMAGWLHGPIDWGHLNDYELHFYEDARRYRLGTLNSIGIAALHAALGVYFDAGPSWCEMRVLENAARLKSLLEQAGLTSYGAFESPHRGGIVTFRCDQADALHASLRARHIFAAVRNGLLRFAPTYYNTEHEIEKVASAVADFLKQHPVDA
jgi:selenocysteine lyase/cysteine desulfurase